MIVTMRARLAPKGKAGVERLIEEAKEKRTTLWRTLLLVTADKRAVTVPRGAETMFFCRMSGRKSESWPRTLVTFFVSRTVQISIMEDRWGGYDVKVTDPTAQTSGEPPYRLPKGHGIQASGVGNMRY